MELKEKLTPEFIIYKTLKEPPVACCYSLEGALEKAKEKGIKNPRIRIRDAKVLPYAKFLLYRSLNENPVACCHSLEEIAEEAKRYGIKNPRIEIRDGRGPY